MEPKAQIPQLIFDASLHLKYFARSGPTVQSPSSFRRRFIKPGLAADFYGQGEPIILFRHLTRKGSNRPVQHLK
jgi:hypothetical protein